MAPSFDWLNTTSVLTPLKVFFKASICICLTTLLMLDSSNADLDPGALRGRDGRAENVIALHAPRLDRLDLVDEYLDVVGQFVVVEAHLADAGVHVAGLVSAVLDLAGLELLDGSADI